MTTTLYPKSPFYPLTVLSSIGCLEGGVGFTANITREESKK